MTSPLALWESFYVVIGSSAGALTGLQFVVIALIAQSEYRATLEQINAFGTPTIVHFCFVLMLAATLSAPWPTLDGPALMLGASAAVGLGYVLIVMLRARRQKDYRPVLADWLWYVILPFFSHAVLLSAAIMLERSTTVALFIIGATSLLLLYVGIHNAWDSVTFIVTERFNGGKKSGTD
jgi:hypothetical protein